MYDEDIREELFFFLEEEYGKSRVKQERIVYSLPNRPLSVWRLNQTMILIKDLPQR